MLDSPDTSRNSGIRVQILDQNKTLVDEKATTSISFLQFVDFTRKDINQFNVPNKPFIVPLTLPIEHTLGTNCGARCQDKAQIDSLVEQFNGITGNPKQIIKVIKATTPSSTRCDYEVEMIRDVDGGKTTVGKELISMSVELASSGINGVLYGRFIRVVPGADGAAGPLSISQIVVIDPTGKNIAIGKRVFATSQLFGFRNPSSIVDGSRCYRSKPEYWVLGNSQRTNEYIEIDLGMEYPISSIKFLPPYDAELSFIKNTRIQVLLTNEGSSVPIWDQQLMNQTTPSTQSITFNKCTFKYLSATYDTTFIQDNTPLLSAVDTSGGVLTFNNIGTRIMNLFSSAVYPLIKENPMGTLDSKVNAAESAVIGLTNSIGATLPITKQCVNVKCTDPVVMNAIMNRYNSDNGIPKKESNQYGLVSTNQFGVYTNVMSQIAGAGVGSPGYCDVLFTELYSQYEDFLYDPLITRNKTLTKRFKMVDTGGCVMGVAPGASSITDVSTNAFGLTSSSAILQVPYINRPCKVNCRDPEILAKVKQSFDAQTSSKVSSYDNSTVTTMQSLTTITQSFGRTPSLCEYMALKDVTTKSSLAKTFSSEPGVSTYLTASFNLDSACKATLQNVTEFDPDTTVASAAGIIYVNGTAVEVPYLMSYDNTNPSTRIQVTSQKL